MLAREANMTYGKWKALQPVVDIKKLEMESWPKCEWCGKPFKKKYGKKFCDDSCRIEANKLKIRKRKTEYMRAFRAKKKEENNEKTAEK